MTIGIIDDHGIVLQGVSSVFASKKEFDVLFAIDNLQDVHTAQMLTYLKLARKELGLLVNFNVPLIKQGIKRVIL